MTPPAPLLHASETASARRCDPCGTPLPPWPGTGRPRLSCSDRCRRLRDHRERKIALRFERIQDWEAQASLFPRAFIRSMVRRLKDEIRALRLG